MSMKNLGKVFPQLLTYHKKTKEFKKKKSNFNGWNRHRKNSYHDVSNTFSSSSKINLVTIKKRKKNDTTISKEIKMPFW